MALAGGGIPLIIQLTRSLAAGNFGADLLAGASIATAAFMGEYLVGAIVVLMLSGGTALEQYATRRASSVLNALAKRMPRIAHRSSDSTFTDVSLDEIVVGDWLLVFPHEICPVDGTVIEGHSTMDESYLTGEPFLISKTPGATVLSGSINGDAALTIAVDKLPADSRYAKIMQVMSASQQSRPHMRRIADRLGAWYTPLALGVALLGLVCRRRSASFPGRHGDRHAVPAAARHSGGHHRRHFGGGPERHHHQESGGARASGSLPHADFRQDRHADLRASRAHRHTMAPGFRPEQVLRLTASLEQYSKHPLASAVLRAAEEKRLKLAPVRLISEKPGEGLQGLVGDHSVRITGREPAGRARGCACPKDFPPKRRAWSAWCSSTMRSPPRSISAMSRAARAAPSSRISSPSTRPRK